MRKGNTKKKVQAVGVYVILLIVCIIMLVPFYFTLINSVKPYSEIMTSFVDLPKEITWDNYVEAWRVGNYSKSFFCSLFVTVGSTVGTIIFSMMASYKLARTKTKVSWFLYILFAFSMTIPFHAIMYPVVQLANALHLSQSLIGIIPIYWGINIPFDVFMYHGFIKGIPMEIEEAALLDGASGIQILFQILSPMLKPITSTLIILNVLGVWNDFLMPMLLLTGNKDIRTIPLTQQNLFGTYASQWNVAIAGLVLGVVPCLIFFLLMQKYIVKGLSSGAVKG